MSQNVWQKWSPVIWDRPGFGLFRGVSRSGMLNVRLEAVVRGMWLSWQAGQIRAGFLLEFP